ncbi:PEBP family protein [Cellulomonas flavigena DSM 20109]|uniref:PEBP family protein n=1 Tax=Cellulomonas flavigena (strain ATCC 482 / DSM 20109 / BCRC 11376 / JCM 18109 / NBRC 3775 / NCIMB 8073 / NRS 134) TaxID=446466 RepID=D5ULT9_CELFN|nr:YbhB/YbcL family Raf kinase inhibitor-like protein [Cellulomonas flavigena]ADG76045.1 PEBP family protein [Cellulomonas flavigena DSM 20109]
MRRSRPVPLLVAVLVGPVLLGLAGCATTSGTASPTDVGATDAAAQSPAPLVLTSPDLDADGALPPWASGVYSTVCDGENRSPALAWEGGPDDVASYLLTLTDPAHPDYVHWVVTGIPGDVDGVKQGEQGEIGVGVAGRSYRGDGLYAGPCVPGNTYVYTLYALDEAIEGDASTTLDDALALVDGHVLAEATLDVTPTAP